MRTLLLIALALAAFVAAMTIKTNGLDHRDWATLEVVSIAGYDENGNPFGSFVVHQAPAHELLKKDRRAEK